MTPKPRVGLDSPYKKTDGDRVTRRDAYYKDSKSKATGKFMKTFSRSKLSQLIQTWDDTDYLTIINQVFVFTDCTGGSVTSANTAHAAVLAMLDVAWELFYTNANLKDLEAAEELAWKKYFAMSLQICMDFQIMYNLRCMLPAYTEADGTSGGTTQISYFSQESFDVFLASMKDIPIPKGVYEIVDIFATWIIKLSEEYEKYTLRVPAAHIQPFNTLYDLEDYQKMRDTVMKPQMGNAITHAKKFGMKMGTWRDPIKPRFVDLTSNEAIGLFNHARFLYDDKNDDKIVVNADGGFMGANETTNYTGVEYLFKDDPNENVLHLFAHWFGLYNATHNQYGGVIVCVPPGNTEYHINLLIVAEHGTAVAASLLGGTTANNILPLYKAYDDSNSATWAVTITATNFTANQVMVGYWKLGLYSKLFVGTNRSANEVYNDILNYVGRLIVQVIKLTSEASLKAAIVEVIVELGIIEPTSAKIEKYLPWLPEKVVEAAKIESVPVL